jgi:hypothetical protein
MATVAITGNTYLVKDQLKALGARWTPDQKAWMITDEKAAEAQKIVAGGPASTLGSSSPTKTFVHRKCTICGHTPRYGDRYDRIYRSGECRDCYEERKMGY